MIRGGVLLFMTRGLAVGGKITLNNQNPEVWCSAIRRNAMHLKERECPIVFVFVWLSASDSSGFSSYLLMRSSSSNEASRGGGECIRTRGHRTVNTLRAPTVCVCVVITLYGCISMTIRLGVKTCVKWTWVDQRHNKNHECVEKISTCYFTSKCVKMCVNFTIICIKNYNFWDNVLAN